MTKALIFIVFALLLSGCFSTQYTYDLNGNVTKTVYFGTYTGDRVELYKSTTEDTPETSRHPVPPPAQAYID